MNNRLPIVNSRTSYIVLAIVSLALGSCSSSRPDSYGGPDAGKDTAPGHARIVAAVVRVDSTLQGNSPNDPCSKTPCMAWIEVKRVVAHGSGTATISPGDTLEARFAFTLGPTNRESFPNLDHELPGLSVGSVFVADIQLMPSPLSGRPKRNVYLIYGYSKVD